MILGAETTGMASQAAGKPSQVVVPQSPLFADDAWPGTIEKEWQIAPAIDRRSLDRETADRYMGPAGFGASRTFGSGLDRPFGENRIYCGLWNHSF